MRSPVLIATSVLALFLIVPSCLHATASNGRIPIFEPTVISESGHYYLTQGLSVSSGTAIDVQASDVTLDLNGFDIRSSGADSPLVNIGSGLNDVVIKNGRLINGAHGIFHQDATGTLTVRVLHLAIEGSSSVGLYLEGVASAQIEHCRVTDTGAAGVHVEGGASPGQITIQDTSIADTNDYGLGLYDLGAGSVRGCQVQRYGRSVGNAYAVDVKCSASSGRKTVSIVQNVVSNDQTGSDAIWVDANCQSALVIQNTINGAGQYGILVYQGAHLILDNVIANSASDGIRLAGAGTLVAGNQLRNNGGYGLYMNTTGSAYRDNMLTGNTSGSVGGQLGEDVGGNVCDTNPCQ